jgi:hypothetical protein
MTTEDDRPLKEKFLDEIGGGYRDGFDPDSPEPSANRSASYAHGRSLGIWPHVFFGRSTRRCGMSRQRSTSATN